VLPALAALTPPLQVQVLHQVLPEDGSFNKDENFFFSNAAILLRIVASFSATKIGKSKSYRVP
jgi:hypothetical protein